MVVCPTPRGAPRGCGCPRESSDSSPLTAFGSQSVLGVLLAFAKHTALSSEEETQAGQRSPRREGGGQARPLHTGGSGRFPPPGPRSQPWRPRLRLRPAQDVLSGLLLVLTDAFLVFLPGCALPPFCLVPGRVSEVLCLPHHL